MTAEHNFQGNGKQEQKMNKINKNRKGYCGN